MALVKGTNSYATVSEANAYFDDRLDVAAWLESNDTQKAQALVTATAMLDDLNWIGSAVSELQALAFPRRGMYFDPRLGTDVVLNETSVPARIVRGCFELAYHLLNNDGLLDNTGTVKDLRIGTISLSVVGNPDKLPAAVKRVIRPLLFSNGSSSWWRAN